MFFFRKLFGLFFLGFIFLGLLGVFGRGGHGNDQSAYEQGFMAGQQAAAASNEAAVDGAAETASAAPSQPPGTNVYYRGHRFFFPGSGLLFCLMPFFLMGMFFMIFGKRRWHGHGHHRGRWGHHRGPWGQGPCGHRKEREDSPQEKSPDDIDDGADEPIMRA